MTTVSFVMFFGSMKTVFREQGIMSSPVKGPIVLIEHISPQIPPAGETLATGYDVDENNAYSDGFLTGGKPEWKAEQIDRRREKIVSFAVKRWDFDSVQ